MFCHYQILGVELNADQETIKKAYRKAALKWHPDKNPDNLDEATEQFRLVQAAYDVLSDLQEKAWYDRHREEILHRKQFENYKNDSIDLFEYFTPSAYKGFGDDEKGFYAIYRDVFAKISSEDKPFCSSDSEDDEMPTFGDSTSDYDEVVHNFYATWQSYTTRMSFVWVSQYDVKEATNRRIARIIEKENKKERDKHRKKRNELVRELVAFVRKRDLRVKAHKLELERLADEQAYKAEERRASLLAERVREAALYEETNREERMRENERLSQLENMMKDEFGFSSGNGSDSQDGSSEYEDDLFCVACNKLFKSEMGMKNHQKSKKHREKMNRLKEEMRDDEIKEETQTSNGMDKSEIKEETKDEAVTSTRKLTKRQKKKNRQRKNLLSNMTSPETDDVSNDRTTIQDNTAPQEDINEITIEGKNGSETSTSNQQCDESKPTEKINSQMDERTSNKKKKNKSNKNLCQMCRSEFGTRNKLFQHLKDTGHSMLIDRK